MSDGLILNEASLPFNSANDCEQNLQLFFSIINEASIQGVSFYRADDMEGEWSSLVYAQDFVFGRWIGAISNSDRDLSLLVKNVISKVRCPLIYTKYNILKEETEDVIFSLSNNSDIEVQGLGVASITKNHGISFSSNNCWKVNPITITQQKDGFEDKQINVANIHSLECLSQLLISFQKQQQSNKTYLSSLTTKKNKNLPNIIFCETALKNMCSSSITIYDFKNIINK